MNAVAKSTWRKACDCAADGMHPRPTASGPRLVVTQRREPGTLNIYVTATLVFMACDRCDKEWEEVKE